MTKPAFTLPPAGTVVAQLSEAPRTIVWPDWERTFRPQTCSIFDAPGSWSVSVQPVSARVPALATTTSPQYP